jgi:hypothetical protein
MGRVSSYTRVRSSTCFPRFEWSQPIYCSESSHCETFQSRHFPVNRVAYFFDEETHIALQLCTLKQGCCLLLNWKCKALNWTLCFVRARYYKHLHLTGFEFIYEHESPSWKGEPVHADNIFFVKPRGGLPQGRSMRRSGTQVEIYMRHRFKRCAE